VNAQIHAIGAVIFGLGSAVFAADRAEPGKDAWQSRYQRAAEEYSLFRDPAHREALTLQAEPVYRWNHAVRDGGTDGTIYVWTYKGCAEAVACFWCMRWADGHATLGHELHSLSPQVLSVVRPGPDEWKPTAAFERKPFDDAPAPASKAASRLTQMRSLASDFSGHGVNARGDRREFRLLTTPVYRYQSTAPEVPDGALFAMVCNVGTDPEAFVLVEARRTIGGPRWHYGIARFSHLDLFVSYRGREVWKAIRGKNDTFAQNPDQTYRSFHVAVEETTGEVSASSGQ
jgi:hypothetical protein